MPKFSIIIPVYNAEKYLDKCICSLLNQDYNQYEIILINDCSSDSSMIICKKYADQYENIILLNQEKNHGVSAARNRGIQTAKGEYILFVDSDDFVAQTYFFSIDKLVSESSDELIAFGHYDYVISKDGESHISLSGMNQNISSDEESPWNKFFLNSFFASPWNKIFLRSVLFQNNILFDISCVCYEDYLFNVEYCKHVRKFKVVDTPLYYYRQYSEINHVSKRNWGDFLNISEKVGNRTNEFIDLHNRDKKIKDIRRYTYRCFLVELEAKKYKKELSFQTRKLVIQNKYFQEAVDSIENPGGTIKILNYAIKLHLFSVGGAILFRII